MLHNHTWQQFLPLILNISSFLRTFSSDFQLRRSLVVTSRERAALCTPELSRADTASARVPLPAATQQWRLTALVSLTHPNSQLRACPCSTPAQSQSCPCTCALALLNTAAVSHKGGLHLNERKLNQQCDCLPSSLQHQGFSQTYALPHHDVLCWVFAWVLTTGSQIMGFLAAQRYTLSLKTNLQTCLALPDLALPLETLSLLPFRTALSEKAT